MRINYAFKAIAKNLVIALLLSLVGLIHISPSAHGAVFGTAYDAPIYSFGGGNNNGQGKCPTDQVVVGIAFQWNPMSNGYLCRSLNANYSIDPLPSTWRTTYTNYVFCPDGKAAAGYKFMNSGGLFVGLICKSPPAMNDPEVLTDFISGTTKIASTAKPIAFTSACNSGDIQIGQHTFSNLWFDALGAVCAGFAPLTVTYNVNGGTGTAPTMQSATVINPVVTISNSYTGTKANFHYLNWNTAANGTGINHIPGDAETLTASMLLYSHWGSYITYDGNSNTSGTAPSRQEVFTTAAATSLAANSGTLARTNYYFAGWNTAANGTGTSYPSSTTAALPANPYMKFDADHYDATTKTWNDTSGNSRNITNTYVRGTPEIVEYTTPANGALGSIKAVSGTTTDGIQIRNSALSSYTFCHVARYSGTNKSRIFGGTSGNWLSGFWGGNTGVAYHEGWITSSVGTADSNWKIQCDTGSSATANSALRSNGVLKSTVANNMTGLPANISINLNGSTTAPTELSDWQVAEFIIYDSVLTNTQINEIEAVLQQKYGILNLASDIYTHNYTSTGDVTLYAQWNSTITYNGNSNTSGTAPAAQTAIGQKPFALQANSGTLARTGFTFEGWNTASDGGGNSYTASQANYVSSGNLTLYAKWKPLAPTSVDLTTASDAGTSSTDNVTNIDTPTVGISGIISGATVVFTATSATGNVVTCTVVASSTTATCTFPDLADGTYSITATQRVGAVTSPASTALTGVVIDTVAPTVVITNNTFTSGSSTNALTNGRYAITFSEVIDYAGFLETELIKSGSNWYFNNFKYAGSTTTVIYYYACANTTATCAAGTSGLNGIASLQVPANVTTDVAGNQNTASNTYVVNWVASITYNANGGSGTIASVNQATSTSSINLSDGTGLTKAGYNLTGWSETANGTAVSSPYTPTVNKTLYAIWTAGVYTVTFNANGATGSPTNATSTWTYAPSGGTGVVITTAATSGNMVKTGYTFAGWNTTAGATTALASPYAATNTANITLYAVWTANTYAVTFNGNSNTGGTVANMAITAGTAKALTTNAYTRTGYTFTGWNTAANGTGTAYANLASVTVFGDLTVYAQWSANTLTVTYNASSGATPTGGITSTVTGGRLTSLATTTRTGYTFTGWFTAATGGTQVTTASGHGQTANFTLYAQWSANTYTLSYDISSATNSPSAIASQNYTTAGTALTISSGSTLTRAPWYFRGWNTAADGSGTHYAASQTSVTLSSNITLYPEWAEAFETPGPQTGVTVTLLGGTTAVTTASTNPKISSGTVNSVTWTSGYWLYAWNATTGYKVTFPAPSTNFSFIYFYAGSGTVLTINFTDNTTATATLNSTTDASAGTYGNVFSYVAPTGKYISSYQTPSTFSLYADNLLYTTLPTVSFNANSGSGSMNSQSSAAAANLNANTFTRAGYLFSGWNTAANGSGTAYADLASYSFASNLALYAQWVGVTYKITYSGNGATSGTLPSQGSYQSGGSAYSVSANSGSLAKTGYTFAGWNNSPDGTGTNYAAAASYSSAADLTLYAKWMPNTYTVTYNGNSNTGGAAPTSVSYTVGNSAISLATVGTLVKTGFTFMGWLASQSDTTTVTSPYIPSANITLYAYWLGNTYSINYDENGATSGTAADTSYQSGAAGISLPTSGLARTGYVFGGWSTTSDGANLVSNSGYTTNTNVTLYAKWTLKTINITYQRGTAAGTTPTLTTFPSNTTSTYGSQYALNSTIDSITALSGINYAFMGWSDSSTVFSGGANYPIGVNDLTFTAQWIAIYTLHYNLNGGTGTVDPDHTYLNNDPFTASAAPSRTGYVFNGWLDQAGSTVAAGAATNISDTRYVLSASWSPEVDVISFGAGTGTGAIASVNQNFGAMYTLPSSTGLTAPAGSIFNGWLINGIKYTAGTSILISGATNAVAQWLNNDFSIYFDVNGGTSGAIAPITGAVSSNQNLPTNPSRTGYVFAGWNTGSSTLSTGATTAVIGSANSTYVATWSLAAPATPSISASPNDGGATITVTSGAGGGAASSYTVTASPGGATCTVISPATSCSIAPLTNGTAYSFTATATNSTGTSSVSSSASVTPAGLPSPPTGLNAIRGDSQATVSFAAPTNTGGSTITGYSVTATPVGGGSPITISCSSSPCLVTGLTNGTAYTFAATASNATGASSNSASTNSVTPAAAPAAPSNVTVSSNSAGTASVSITSGANNGAAITSYTVTATPTSGSVITITCSSTPCSVTGLIDGISYTYSVTESNAVGTSSAASTTPTLTTQAPASAPTNVQATAGDSNAVVTFSPSISNGSTINSYTVTAYDQGGNSTNDTCTVSVSANPLGCTITGLTNGSIYTFEVTANSTANGATTDSESSLPSPQRTPAAPPSAPTILTPVSGSNKVTVSWAPGATNGAVVTGYTVTAYLSDGTPTSFTCVANNPNTTQCDVTGLAVGVDYKFAVVTNASAPSNSSASAFSSLQRMNSAPSQPDAPVVTPGTGSASVAMNVPYMNGASVTGYHVTATPANGGSPITVSCNTSPCSVGGLTNGISYAFTYTATNSLGTSVASPSTSATPFTVPGIPTSVSAGANDSGATITYTAPSANGSAITSYTITATPIGGGSAITVVDSNSPSTIIGLTNGVTYSITVAATNAAGTGTASGPVTVTPRPDVAPALVSDIAPTGVLYVGNTLTAQANYSGAPTPTITYQWQSCSNSICTDISGATASTFALTPDLAGSTILVKTVATNSQGSSYSTSPETLPITEAISFTAPTSGLNGSTGTAFSLTNSATGGAGSFTYSLNSGSIPAGTALNSSTGEISGTPTSAGSTTATIRATDANSVSVTNTFTITITGSQSQNNNVVVNPTPTPTPTPDPEPSNNTCDSSCQTANDVAAKAAADAAAASAKAAADAAALAAAKQTITTQQALANQAAAAAAKAQAAQQAAAAQATAAQAAAVAAAQKAATLAAAASKTPTTNTVAGKAAIATAQAQATVLAAQAAAAVKSASTAAATAVAAVAAATAAQSQLAIQITNIKVSATTANTSAATAQAAVATATAQQAAAKAAQTNAAQVAAAAKIAADKAAADAASAATAKAAADAAAQKAAADAVAQQKVAEKAAVDKVAADKAAVDAANKLVEAAQSAAKAAEALTKATTSEEKAAAQSALDVAKSDVQKAQDVVDSSAKTVEAKAVALEKATEAADKASDHADAKSDAATKAAENLAVKQATVEVSKEVVAAVTQQVAVAKAAVTTATANVAAAVAVAAKVTASNKTTSSKGKAATTAKVTINNLKPGQRIKVTVNKK
jgi:uncharacterized repeat protein (TIGR02543 family)